jgi:hypothetical protein
MAQLAYTLVGKSDHQRVPRPQATPDVGQLKYRELRQKKYRNKIAQLLGRSLSTPV